MIQILKLQSSEFRVQSFIDATLYVYPNMPYTYDTNIETSQFRLNKKRIYRI